MRDIVFEVDGEIKKKRLIQNRKTQKNTKIIMSIALGILLIGSAISLWCLLHNVFSTNACIVNVNGVPKKDYSWIIILESFCLVPTILIPFFLRLLANNIAGAEITSRVDEKLLFENDNLIYTYRLRYHTFLEQRMEVVIDLKNIQEVKYNTSNGKIGFNGEIRLNYYEDFRTNKISKTQIGNEFSLFDYFTPELYEFIKSIRFVRREQN